MNSEHFSRARRILIVREDGAQESWERGKGKEDQLWRDQMSPRSITSPGLVDLITSAIEA